MIRQSPVAFLGLFGPVIGLLPIVLPLRVLLSLPFLSSFPSDSDIRPEGSPRNPPI